MNVNWPGLGVPMGTTPFRWIMVNPVIPAANEDAPSQPAVGHVLRLTTGKQK